jgi:hypothetical protein
MPRRCIAPAGHSDGRFAYDHGPWEWLPKGSDRGTGRTTQGTSGRTETGVTIANPQVGGGEAGDNGADTGEPMFGGDGCTCRPWTRQTNPPRYLDQPGDTADMISGWERGENCPSHTLTPPADRDRGGQ